MRTLIVMPFVALAFFAWGVFGPTLHTGEDAMGGSSLRTLTCVGLAYLVVAVVAPLAVLRTQGETGRWTLIGVIWSFAAGATSALGALGIILSFKFGGKPIYVMPLVFGCAPVANTFVTMAMMRSFREANTRFFLGVLLIAIGAIGILLFKPAENGLDIADLTIRQFILILTTIGFAAFCWGAYGPILHRGQMRMAGSRLRPYLGVGLSYFIVAVVLPLILLWMGTESGGWSLTGIVWSHAAGVAAAVGALGIVLAFHFGGKPIYVMPLVFGGAPVVNTWTTLATGEPLKSVPWLFLASVLMVILGAVSVLLFAPRAQAPSPASEED